MQPYHVEILGLGDAVCVCPLYSLHALVGKEIQTLEYISSVQEPRAVQGSLHGPGFAALSKSTAQSRMLSPSQESFHTHCFIEGFTSFLCLRLGRASISSSKKVSAVWLLKSLWGEHPTCTSQLVFQISRAEFCYSRSQLAGCAAGSAA